MSRGFRARFPSPVPSEAPSRLIIVSVVRLCLVRMGHRRAKLMEWVEKEEIERSPHGDLLGGRGVGTWSTPNHNGQTEAAGHRDLSPVGLWLMDLV